MNSFWIFHTCEFTACWKCAATLCRHLFFLILCPWMKLGVLTVQLCCSRHFTSLFVLKFRCDFQVHTLFYIIFSFSFFWTSQYYFIIIYTWWIQTCIYAYIHLCKRTILFQKFHLTKFAYYCPCSLHDCIYSLIYSTHFPVCDSSE